MQRRMAQALGYALCSYLDFTDTRMLLSCMTYSAAYKPSHFLLSGQAPRQTSGWVWIIISGQEGGTTQTNTAA